MPRPRKPAATGPRTADYRHQGSTRKNNPPAKIASEGKIPKVEPVPYAYSPHLPPVLRFDPDGDADKLPRLLEKARTAPLSEDEVRLLSQALRTQEPWLEWSGKAEEHRRRFFEVDPVALHIHERVSTQAILDCARRTDVARDLFADPELEYREAVKFYQHDVDWANRLILGDSLEVMSSLATRENLAGKVQMIYMDPPYGIKFASNFQPLVGERDVKDKEQDLTREPEMVKAYRDTWHLGVHSYLSYLRDRLISAPTSTRGCAGCSRPPRTASSSPSSACPRWSCTGAATSGSRIFMASTSTTRPRTSSVPPGPRRSRPGSSTATTTGGRSASRRRSSRTRMRGRSWPER